MPAQRRLTVAGVCVPNLDAVVTAATGNLLAIWAEANTQDFPVKCSIVSTHHTFENKKQEETAVTYLECPLSVDTHCPVEASQILTVLSSLALARDLPSGLQTTERTLRLR